MKARELSGVARDLHTLCDNGAIGGLTDGHLLDRYVDERDDAAFAMLIERHGSMVWGVCRRVMGNRHDAEDVFQATFLVLATRAASIVPREMVPNWLYGVAWRTAMKARAVASRRQGKEKHMVVMPEVEVSAEAPPDDRLRWLDHELSHLPARYRLPIILCELEGLTYQEAARRLACPIGTLAARLSRAKSLLARRLLHRGVAVSAGGLSLMLAQESAAAAMPASLAKVVAEVAPLFKAAQSVAAGLISRQAMALARRTILLARLKIVAAFLASLAVLGSTTGLLARLQSTDRRATETEMSKIKEQHLQVATKPTRKPAVGPILTGRMADESGKPLAGVKVVLYSGFATRWKGQEAITDTDGRYRFDPLRTGGLIKDEPSGRWDHFVGMKVEHATHVSADGRSWWDIDVPTVDRREQIKNFRMVPGGRLKGRLLDPKTKEPVGGVALRIHGRSDHETTFDSYATTDLQGRFTSEALFPGRYIVDVNSPELNMLALGTVEIEKSRILDSEFSLDKLRWAIARAIEGTGGSMRLDALKAYSATVRQTVVGAPAATTMKYSVQRPDQYRVEIVRPGSNETILLILSGPNHKLWTKRDGENFRLAQNGATGMSGSVDDIGPLEVRKLKDPSYRPTPLQDVTVDGRPCFGIGLTKGSRPGPLDFQMFFDRENGRLVRLDDIAAQTVHAFTDYREFGAISLATKTAVRSKDGGPAFYKDELIDFKAVHGFDTRLFEEP